MKISSSSQQQVNPINLDYTSKKNDVKENKKSSLGGNVRKNSVLDQLIKQKQDLIDSKKDLMDRTLKSGEDQSSIKDTLKGIDDQIKEIDSQISKVHAEEQHKALGSDKKKNETKRSKVDSSNGMEAENEGLQMDSMLKLSGNLEKTQTLAHQNKSMEGETGVIKCEIKQDELRGLNPIKKIERVAQLEDQMQNIAGKIGDNLNTINNEIKNVSERSTSSGVVDKNKQTEDKSSQELQQIAQNIQCYHNNLPENEKQGGEKVNATA